MAPERHWIESLYSANAFAEIAAGRMAQGSERHACERLERRIRRRRASMPLAVSSSATPRRWGISGWASRF